MTLIDVRQLQYLNNILTQDHRAMTCGAMTCVTRRVMEFKFVEAALRTLAEIEVMPTIKHDDQKGGIEDLRPRLGHNGARVLSYSFKGVGQAGEDAAVRAHRHAMRGIRSELRRHGYHPGLGAGRAA